MDSQPPPSDSAPSVGLTSDAAPFIPDIDPDADAVTASFDYTNAELYILPVVNGSKNAGSVLGKRWQTKSTRDPQVAVAWFAAADHGIALHCGRSGLVVIDVDDPDEVPKWMWTYLDTAPFQSTRPDQPRRGHYIFLMPPGRTIGNGNGHLGAGWGEVRGLNGVIVVAPTRHSTPGAEYRWVRTGAIPALPGRIADKLPEASASVDAASDAVVRQFLEDHQTATRPDVLNGLKSDMLKKIEAGASRHDAARNALVGAMKEARAGFYGARSAVEILIPPVLNAMQIGKGKRTEAEAKSELRNLLAWAVGQALAADLDEVRKRVEEKMPKGATDFESPETEQADPPPRHHVERSAAEQSAALDKAHAVFRKWLGPSYDLDALDATLATLAVERLGGDPLWLLNVTGSGNAKTETVCAAADVDGVVITSSIASEGALLSATSKRERTAEANGGLLRKLGHRGTLVVKDVTTILSMDRTARGQVLAALREVYDGLWVRNVGTDGGREIPWSGRIALLGAVTSAWDTHHTVVAAMGDRFVLLRTSSREGRRQAGRQALRNIGGEKNMRTEMAAVVAEVIAGVADGAAGAELTRG